MLSYLAQRSGAPKNGRSSFPLCFVRGVESAAQPRIAKLTLFKSIFSIWHSTKFSRPRSVAVLVLVTMIVVGGTPQAQALPAFARKYGLRCSACHESWPMLNYFGQKFKDNGYQLMNDRDAPIWQNPGYWPVTFRMTPV